MTIRELRRTEDYINEFEKIKSMDRISQFTLRYFEFTRDRERILKAVVIDCINNGLLYSLKRKIDLTGRVICETFIRL